MKSSVYHIIFNISDPKKSIPFYKSFLGYLGYKLVDESSERIGASNGTTDIWVLQTERKYRKRGFHRKSIGLNHIAFRVESKNSVDDFTKGFLRRKRIKTLYDSSRFFPEYRKGSYAVYFEDPDRIKLEVVYTPLKN
jgi:catechol 2,3-dioxygenase-like lactoylglutathione lyase family enzyme